MLNGFRVQPETSGLSIIHRRAAVGHVRKLRRDNPKMAGFAGVYPMSLTHSMWRAGGVTRRAAKLPSAACRKGVGGALNGEGTLLVESSWALTHGAMLLQLLRSRVYPAVDITEPRPACHLERLVSIVESLRFLLVVRLLPLPVHCHLSAIRTSKY